MGDVSHHFGYVLEKKDARNARLRNLEFFLIQKMEHESITIGNSIILKTRRRFNGT